MLRCEALRAKFRRNAFFFDFFVPRRSTGNIAGPCAFSASGPPGSFCYPTSRPLPKSTARMSHYGALPSRGLRSNPKRKPPKFGNPVGAAAFSGALRAPVDRTFFRTHAILKAGCRTDYASESLPRKHFYDLLVETRRIRALRSAPRVPGGAAQPPAVLCKTGESRGSGSGLNSGNQDFVWGPSLPLAKRSPQRQVHSATSGILF